MAYCQVCAAQLCFCINKRATVFWQPSYNFELLDSYFCGLAAGGGVVAAGFGVVAAGGGVVAAGFGVVAAGLVAAGFAAPAATGYA